MVRIECEYCLWIDLPCLKCIYSDGNSFLYQYQVIIQGWLWGIIGNVDIPQISDIHLPNAFQKVRKLSIISRNECDVNDV